jgi:phosphate transport system substrate-binding protein
MKAMSIFTALAALVLAHDAAARDQILVVGSSTVFPFATMVAERFGKSGDFKPPILESTGTGGGMKLFCAGVGAEYPDMANASREITDSELKSCAANGVTAITEVKIGFDGIVIANNISMPPLDVTLDQLYLALAKEVPERDAAGAFKAIPTIYQKWSEIDPALPRYRITVYGPPPTSGTRDAFMELVMLPGCRAFAGIRAALQESGTDGGARAREVCQTLRGDGGYIEAGENDELIVQKLEAYPIAFGIFGYGFLHANADALQGATINGVQPTFDSIAGGTYPISRSLYIYVKNANSRSVPGVREFLAEFTSEEAIGPAGYLVAKGLVPLPPEQRVEARFSAETLKPLTN